MVRVDFVVYTAPNGKKDKQYIELTDELLSPMDQPAFEKKVKALQKAGYEFSAEILSTGKINFQIDKGDLLLAIHISDNDIHVVAAVINLVNDAYAKWEKLKK